ncbi:MAG: Asp23/Gls24 family envelope stress response protein [Lapillicoccus sp.]
MAVTMDTRLGCGRDVDEVWDSIDQPPNEHERTCPYCTRARANLAELSTATHELTIADQQDPSLRVPAERLANVLAIVRTEVRRGRSIPLQRPVSDPHHDLGNAGDTGADAGADTAADAVPDLTVSEQVIATVVRETCDRNPDVEVRRVSIDIAPATAARREGGSPSLPRVDEMQPTDVVMDLEVTVSHTAAIPDLIDGLRRRIMAAVASQIGVIVSRINIHVQDLHDA